MRFFLWTSDGYVTESPTPIERRGRDRGVLRHLADSPSDSSARAECHEDLVVAPVLKSLHVA